MAPLAVLLNISGLAPIRALGATAVRGSEASSGRRTQERGGALAPRPHSGPPGPRDTLKIPHVVTRFLAAEVCFTTTRLRRPRRVGPGPRRPARSPPPGHQLGNPPPPRPARRSRRRPPVRPPGRRLRRALCRLYPRPHHQHPQSPASDVAGAGDRRAPPRDPHRTLRRPVRQTALRQPGNPRRRQPPLLSRR